MRSSSREGPGTGPPRARARAVRAHCGRVLDAAGAQCVAVKFQVACFERLGAPGWAALGESVRDASDRGLLVIADAKRGDIDVSARAYGQAFFGETETPFGIVPGLGVDALTVSPLLGRDSVAPLVQAARAHAGGVFVLVRTSNPGAADVQELELAGGGTVSDRLAGLVAELGRQGIGRSGLSDVGAVTGRDRARADRGAARRRCRTPSSCSRGSEHRAAESRIWRPRSRRVRPAGWCPRRGESSTRTSARVVSRNGRRRTKRPACESWPGASRRERAPHAAGLRAPDAG